MHRKLATIMVGDIVGSTRQMEQNEEDAIQRFSECLGAVTQTVNQHEGRVFNQAGDSVLAEFQSPVNALRAAMVARGKLNAIYNSRAVDMRFGLHLADVVEVDGDLRGDGVNIAARIQATADPGAIDASQTLFDQVRRNSPCIFDDIGERHLAGVSEPIHLYRVRGEIGYYRTQPSEQRGSRPLAKRPHSIAVVPLSIASSADPDQSVLAEGLTEDLILELGRMKQLFVISASASRGLPNRDPATIGTDLGVRYVLTGSVRALGSRLRLNLTLLGTDDGRVIWSDRIQRPFDEFVDMMEDVAARITATVTGRVLEADTNIARKRPAETLTAYEYYLRGLDYHRRGGVTDDNIRTAMTWFEKAISADGNFARAQAMWVCSASWLTDYDFDDGKRRVERALELDPNDPEATRIMGSILIYEGKFDAARQYHRKAMELAPNDAYIVGRCAAFHNFAGEPDTALELLDRAAELDPFLPVWITEERIAAYYQQGHHEKVLEAARSLPFQTRRCRIYRAASRVALGDLEGARKIVAEALGNNPDLNRQYIRENEVYQDQDILETLVSRLEAAGLPA